MSLRHVGQDPYISLKNAMNATINKNAQNLCDQSCKSSLHSSRYSKAPSSQFNFQLHDSKYCVCEQCECGQHKCQFQCVKPELRCSSTYRNSYRKTGNNFNKEQMTQFTPRKTVEKTIDNKTTYQEKFPQKQINVQKPIKHPDNQKFTGPSLELTTYQQRFPGYAGKNPYVKKKPDQFRGGMKFKGESMYDSQFLPSKMDVNKSLKRPDNLRTSSCWFGRSSYKQSFKVQNPEDLRPLDYKPKGRYDKRPSSAYQFGNYAINFRNQLPKRVRKTSDQRTMSSKNVAYDTDSNNGQTITHGPKQAQMIQL